MAQRFIAPFIAAFGLLFLLFACLSVQSGLARAAPDLAPDPGQVRYISPAGLDTGNDCTESDRPCATLQQAVDAAQAGDAILMAGGIYTDVRTVYIYPLGTLSQSALITKSLSISGGYSPADWANPDSAANPTIIDPAGRGRGLYITGPITVTLSGLRIQGATAGTKYGGGYYDGGGIYINKAKVALKDSQLLHNWAGSGGGIYALEARLNVNGSVIAQNNGVYNGGGLWLGISDASIENNQVLSNTVSSGGGGGIEFTGSNGYLNGNTISGNRAEYGGGVDVRYIRTGDPRGVQIHHNLISLNRSYDSGGGLHVESIPAEITHNTVLSNTSGYHGGGFFIESSYGWRVEANTITGNSAVHGGGVYLWGDGQFERNSFHKNTAQEDGGGAFVVSNYSPVVFEDNTLQNNHAVQGGGIFLDYGDQATLIGNRVMENSAERGGGLFVAGRGPVTSTLVLSNTAKVGAGLYVQSPGSFYNLVVRGNAASEQGSGIFVDWRDARFYHTTIAENHGANDSGFYLGYSSYWPDVTAWLTETIITGQTAGVYVDRMNSLFLDGVLWWGNKMDTAGPGKITVRNDTEGDPRFAPDGYHLTAVSAAIDRGVSTSSGVDFDGQPRPQGAAPDLGADEWVVETQEPVIPPSEVALSGPSTGRPGESLTFLAQAGPLSTSQPVTYTWQADGLPPVVHTGGLTDTVALAWDIAGDHRVSVTVANTSGQAQASHPVRIVFTVFTPLITR